MESRFNSQMCFCIVVLLTPDQNKKNRLAKQKQIPVYVQYVKNTMRQNRRHQLVM